MYMYIHVHVCITCGLVMGSSYRLPMVVLPRKENNVLPLLCFSFGICPQALFLGISHLLHSLRSCVRGVIVASWGDPWDCSHYNTYISRIIIYI